MSRVREEHGSGMVRLWNVRQEVERGIVVDEERLRVPALTSDIVWSLHGTNSISMDTTDGLEWSYSLTKKIGQFKPTMS